MPAPALLDPACYPHPVESVRVIETHISWVFLTGRYAYKIKKPVALGFLDFSTLASRRRYCEEELRLNRRFAPDLYLEMVEVRDDAGVLRVDQSGGALVDYAVKMRQFPQEALGSRLLAEGHLGAPAITALAAVVARLHGCAPADAGAHGTPEMAQRNALQNFEQIGALLASKRNRRALAKLEAWTRTCYASLHDTLAQRHAGGMVREVHGDLHLGNIVLIDGLLTPFDCIEFNEDLRWNDVMSEVAFLVMDLTDRGAPELAHVFLDAYLADTGDYAGLAVLRYFMVYRALVRAKVHLMRAGQTGEDTAERERLTGEFRNYVRLAVSFTRPDPPVLLVMHGMSGCGKSTLARALLQVLGAVRVRSDVERKRLAGLRAGEASRSPLGGGLYTGDATEATYDRLAALVRIILEAGYPAIADATFLEHARRERMQALARTLGVRSAVIDVEAPDAVLRQRILARAVAARDPSEATLEVLDRQLAAREALTPRERATAVLLNGQNALGTADCERIAHKLYPRTRWAALRRRCLRVCGNAAA